MDHREVTSISDALLSLMREIAEEGRAPQTLSLPDKEWRLITAGTQPIPYRRAETRAAVAAFREKFVCRKQWRDKWSDSHLQQAERALLGAAFASPVKSSVFEATKTAAAQLETEPPRYTVVLPIARLHIGKIRFEFPNVRIYTIGKRRRRQIRQSFYEIIATTPHSDEEKRKLRADVVEMTELLLNRPCAEVTVRGDSEKAIGNARRAIEPILDWFQLIASIHEPSEHRIRIHVGGDLLTKQPSTLAIATDRSNIRYENSKLFDFRLQLDRGKLRAMNRAGFRTLFEVLRRQENLRSAFESSLLRAMHWIADADRQELLENKITSYITAIEMFFTTEGGSPISRDIAEGCAVILGTGVKNRRELANEITELYRLRNRVSHAGQLIENRSAEHKLGYYAVNLLATLSRMAPKFASVKEFREWLKERRLRA